MKSTAAIVDALAPFKRYGTPFDVAWKAVCGEIPRHGGNAGETVEHATYRFLKAAYNDTGKPIGLDLSSVSDGDLPARGKSMGVAV